MVLGFALPWCLVATITLTQRLVPLESQGRASAAVGLLLLAPQPLTQAAGAGLVTVVDHRLGFLLVAVVPSAVAAAALRPVRRPESAADGQPGPGSA